MKNNRNKIITYFTKYFFILAIICNQLGLFKIPEVQAQNTQNQENINLPIIPVDSSITQVLETRNKVEMINIATPNSNAVSHNLYQDFNVNQTGLILNNSTATQDGIVLTKLGGWIENNPNLKDSGSANLIINEVAGNNISQLQGHLEIAGKKADLIIANPNGLLINNAGFINTGNLSLIVGKRDETKTDLEYLLNSQSLAQDQFNQISPELQPYQNKLAIIGSGLDVTNNPKTQLIAKVISIAGNIYADNQELIIQSANQSFNFNNNKLNSITCVDNSEQCLASNSNQNDQEQVSIDASSLAKIQAGKIFVIANQYGFAVNWLADTIAQNSGIIIDNQGNIKYQNLLANQGNIEIRAQDHKIIGQGFLQTKKLDDTDLNIGNVNYNVDLQAKNIELLELSRIVSASKTNILASQKFINSSNQSLISDGDALIKAKNIENYGIIIGNNSIKIEADEVKNFANISAQKIIEIIGLNINNQAEIKSNDQLLIKAIDLKNANDDLSVLGKLTAKNFIKIDLEFADQDIVDQANQNLYGSIYSAKDLEIKGSKLVNQAKIIADNNILISTTKDLVNNAEILAKNDLTINTNQDFTNDNLAKIISGNLLTITSQNNLENKGEISSTNNLTLTVINDLNNYANAKIISDLNQQITVKNLLNQGEISAKQNLDITSSTNITNDNLAKIISGNLLTITSQNNLENKGEISSTNNLTLTVINDLNNYANAKIISDLNQQITVKNLLNQGEISAKQNLDITSSTNITNDNLAKIISGNLLTITSQNNLENRGEISSTNNLTLTVINDLNNYANAKIISDLNQQITVKNLLNQGEISAKQNLDITSSTNITNDNLAKIISGNLLTITSQNNLENKGEISSANSLTISSTLGNISNLVSGSIISADNKNINLIAINGDITQQSTKAISSNGNLEINAKNLFNHNLINAKNNILLKLSNDLINFTNAEIIAKNDLSINVVNQVINNSKALIYAENNLEIQKYHSSNSAFDPNNNKTKLVVNRSGEITGFLAETKINAEKLENKREIDPAIALVENPDATLMTNHNSYKWQEDSSLCQISACATGVTKFRAPIPVNINSSPALIRSGGKLTLNVNEIINQASSIIAKSNLQIVADTLNNNTMNYYAKIYQKTIDENGVITDQQYFDDMDNNRSFLGLIRYNTEIQKTISNDLSNASIEKSSSNFLGKSTTFLNASSSSNSLDNIDKTSASSKSDLNLLTQDFNFVDLQNNLLPLPIINISSSPIKLNQEKREEFIDRNVLMRILYPEIVIPQNPVLEDNSQLIVDSSGNQNSNLISQNNNQIINEIQMQFDQQIKNQIGDQFVISNNYQQQLTVIEKNNLLSSVPNNPLISNESFIVNNLKNPELTSSVNYIVKAKNNQINKEIKMPDNQDSYMASKNNTNISKKIINQNLNEIEGDNQLANNENSVSDDLRSNSFVVNNSRNSLNQFAKEMKDKVVAVSKSKLGKTIVEAVSPVILTGSRFSKIIINKSQNNNSNPITAQSNNSFESQINQDHDKKIEEILLKTKILKQINPVDADNQSFNNQSLIIENKIKNN